MAAMILGPAIEATDRMALAVAKLICPEVPVAFQRRQLVRSRGCAVAENNAGGSDDGVLCGLWEEGQALISGLENMLEGVQEGINGGVEEGCSSANSKNKPGIIGSPTEGVIVSPKASSHITALGGLEQELESLETVMNDRLQRIETASSQIEALKSAVEAREQDRRQSKRRTRRQAVDECHQALEAQERALEAEIEEARAQIARRHSCNDMMRGVEGVEVTSAIGGGTTPASVGGCYRQRQSRGERGRRGGVLQTVVDAGQAGPGRKRAEGNVSGCWKRRWPVPDMPRYGQERWKGQGGQEEEEEEEEEEERHRGPWMTWRNS